MLRCAVHLFDCQHGGDTGMSEWISSMVLRLFAGGVLCSLILIITGDGAQREIARIGCAALMIILILSPARPVNWSEFSLTQTEQGLELTVDEALDSARLQQKAQADQQLQTQIEAQAAALGVSCQAQVTSDLTGDGVYSVRQVALRFAAGTDASLKAQAIQTAALNCGIGVERVVEETEGSP